MSAPKRNVHLCAGAVGVFADFLHGFTPVGLSEINEYAINLSRLRYPDARPLGDLTKLSPQQILDLSPDQLSAGWPCTSLSRIGNRGGMKKGSGEPSALIWPILDVITGCAKLGKPLKRVFLENVTEALDSPDFPLILDCLRENGYRVAYCKSMCNVNVFLPDGRPFSYPHKRPRMWLLAVHEKGHCLGELTPPSHEDLTDGALWTTLTARARGSRAFRRPEFTRSGKPSKSAGRLRDDLETQMFIEHERTHGDGSSKGLRARPEFAEALMGLPPQFTNLNVAGRAEAFAPVHAVVPGRKSDLPREIALLDDPAKIDHGVGRFFVCGNGQNVHQLVSAYKFLESKLNPF